MFNSSQPAAAETASTNSATAGATTTAPTTAPVEFTTEKLAQLASNLLSKANFPIRSNLDDNQVVYARLSKQQVLSDQKAEQLKQSLLKIVNESYQFGFNADDDNFIVRLEDMDLRYNTAILRAIQVILKNRSQSGIENISISLISAKGDYTIRLNSTKGWNDEQPWFACRINQYVTGVTFKPNVIRHTVNQQLPAQSGQSSNQLDELF